MELKPRDRSFADCFFRRPVKHDLEFYNPLKINVGSIVNIDSVGLSVSEFRLDSIAEYEFKINDNTFVFLDYNLSHLPLKGDKINIKLRVMAVPKDKRGQGREHQIILLTTDYYIEFDQAIYDEIQLGIADKFFKVTDDGDDDGDGISERDPVSYKYERMHGAEESCHARVATVADEDGNGKFDPEEVKRHEVEYVDFGREVNITDTITETEFYIVEINKDDGMISMFKGTEISQGSITVI